jgi:predicted protein tyrosine phosphatase
VPAGREFVSVWTMTEPLRVLFVCAMNQRRSATSEQIYRNDARLAVRSAGLRSEARRRISEQDLQWAEVVFVMEREHKATLRSRFSHLALPPIEVLDVPDDYEYMDVHLQEMLRLTLDPELAMLVAAKAQRA